MEEEKKNDNIENKEDNIKNPSSDSSQSNEKSNKYKSRKNNKNENTSGSSKSSKRVNPLSNVIKNYAANKAMNALPGGSAINALNAANNIRKIIQNRPRRNVAATSQDNENNTSKDENRTVSSNQNDNYIDDTPNEDNTEQTNESTTLNPFKTLLDRGNSFQGVFSFFGRVSLPIKIAIIVAPVFLGFFILILILAIPLGAHSSLFGLNSSSSGTNTGSNSGTIDYGDYTLSSDGDSILNQSLESFLSSNGSSLEEFNNLIASNVNEAGYGTRAGVVAAAVTLIAELGNNYDVKIPYFYSGGHDAISNYANGVWGAGSCHTYANGVFYDRCGLDCSGFVSWAVSNGGFNVSITSSGGFQNLPGAERVSLQDSAVLQPGDILETNGHVILVVGIEDNQYVCAEASGKITGVIFSRHSFNMSGYWGVKMDGFYNMQVRS